MAINAGRYKATESASSKHPGDWGRAMARAMAEVAEQAAEIEGATHEDLYGEDLHLVIVETDDGVQITLTWDPEQE